MKTLKNLSLFPTSVDASTKLIFLRWRIISKLLCLMVGLLIISPANLLATKIDGNVEGFAEGYTSDFNVIFNIENGPSGIEGGKLFLFETVDLLSVGLIMPLNICDNTYGGNRALDWGTEAHFLIGGGGGKSLEGSDGWELGIVVDGADNLKLKLDYIAIDIDKNSGDFSFDAEIKEFKQGKTKLDTGLTFATSLDYNYNVLGLTQFFGTKTDDEDGTPIDSPGPAPLPYNFASPAEAWIPEIMYEFSINKSAFSGTFSELEFYKSSTFHVSPNKFGSKKAYPILGILGTQAEPVPEPGTLLLLATGLTGLAGYGKLRFRRKKKV